MIYRGFSVRLDENTGEYVISEGIREIARCLTREAAFDWIETLKVNSVKQLDDK